MKQQDFEITIGADGEVKIHIKGIKGKRCLEVAKMFEEMIGETKEQELTAEYYEPGGDVEIHLPQKGQD